MLLDISVCRIAVYYYKSFRIWAKRLGDIHLKYYTCFILGQLLHYALESLLQVYYLTCEKKCEL